MARNVLAVLVEITDALDGIASAIDGKSFAEFETDWLLRHGVQRGIEIVSEAVRHLPDALLAADRPDLPWPQMRAVGNFLRHEYHRVSDVLVWQMVPDDLPALRHAVEAMKRKLETDGA
jgi:uncharacterized protein with HEPN domain